MVRGQSEGPKILIKKHGIKIMREFLEKNNHNLKNDFRIAFIRCSCESEILVAKYQYNILEISLFDTQSSIKSKRSWYQRLRYILHIIIKGEPYTDQIMLEKNQINELQNFLNNLDP